MPSQEALLIQQWPKIVGESLATLTKPQKITFRNHSEPLNGLLHLYVESAAALEIQHQTLQIIEKIAQFYGKPLVRSIRILQVNLQ